LAGPHFPLVSSCCSPRNETIVANKTQSSGGWEWILFWFPFPLPLFPHSFAYPFV
jgi:hypothetical protein